MTNLTREEYVWLAAFQTASKKMFWTDALLEADSVLKSFRERFPAPKRTIQDNVDAGVYSDWSRQTAPVAEERRGRWIIEKPGLVPRAYLSVNESDISGGAFYATELRPGEVIVTRESLADAWTSFVSVNTDSEYFKNFCAALGLKD